MLKKAFALFVKFLISLLPLSLKLTLKSNPSLLALYSKLLQRSGLFYGFPTKRQWLKDYNKYLPAHEQLLNQFLTKEADINATNRSNINLTVVINVTRKTLHLLERTCQNLLSIGGEVEITLWLEKRDPKVSAFLQNHPTITQVNSLDELEKLTSESNENSYLFINAGDILHPKALVLFLSTPYQQYDVVYSDIDTLSTNEERQIPSFFPDWNPDLQTSSCYVKTGVLFNSLSVLNVFNELSYDEHFISKWMFRLANSQLNLSVGHIPFVLIHQLHSVVDNKLPDLTLDWVKKFTNSENVELGMDNLVYKVNRLIGKQPLVSLIIPTKNAKSLVKACIESILDKSTYKNFEILLVDNNSDEQASLEYFDELSKHDQIRVLKYPHPFNYSAINNFAVTQANGDIIGLVNNDIEVITPQWLEYLVGHAMRPEIGCVGAKLLYTDGRIQHAGVVMGYGGGAGHAHKYFPRYHPGYTNRLIATQNYSAVTAACLFVKKTDYLDVNGLNEDDLTVAFNDVDFCLKVLTLGRRNLYCADVELFHHESVSRGAEDTPEKQARFARELEYLQSTWANYISHDPAYNQHLTLRRENFSINKCS